MGATKKRTQFVIAYEILRAVHDQPGLHNTELAQIARLNGVQVNRFLGYMLSCHWIDCQDDCLSLTAKGHRAAEVAEEWWSLMRDALQEGPLAHDYDTNAILDYLEHPISPRNLPLVLPAYQPEHTHTQPVFTRPRRKTGWVV